MRLTDVVTATTPDPLYSEFIPAFVQTWKSLIPEIRIWILFIGDQIPEDLQEYSSYLVLFPAPEGVNPVFVSQMVRLLFPGTLNSGDQAVLITDMDMLPLNSSYYEAGVAGIPSDHFVIYRDDIDHQEIPMCYCAATSEVWGDLFGVTKLDQIPSKLQSLIPQGYDGLSGGSGWYSDQKYLYQVVMNSQIPKKIWTDSELGFHRLDRLYMGNLNQAHLDQVHQGRFSDYHAKRPYSAHQEENSQVVEAILNRYTERVQLVDPDPNHARIEDIHPEDLWPKFLLNTGSDPIENCIRTTGSWEVEAILQTQQLLSSSSPGSSKVFLDLDPGIGVWVLTLVRLSRPNLKGFALADLNQHQLAGNIFLNGLSNQIKLVTQSQLDSIRPDLVRIESVWKLSLVQGDPIVLIRNSPQAQKRLRSQGWVFEEFFGYLKATRASPQLSRCSCQISSSAHHFIGHDGHKMDTNESFYFADHFDWILTRNIAIQKPPTDPSQLKVYLKLDYLPKWISEIKRIDRPFILVTGCSDYSPPINFPNEFEQILKLENLKQWYGENLGVAQDPRLFPLTVGLATHQISHGLKLMQLHRQTDPKFKLSKIFSCFRLRTENCCGEEFIERKQCKELIQNPLFDNFEDLPPQEFLQTLAQYRWCFCPLGNGLDHSPKLLECLLVKTIPICKKTPNSYKLYQDYPIIWIDDFEADLNDLPTFEDFNWCRIPLEFSHQYWFDKIGGPPNTGPTDRLI